MHEIKIVTDIAASPERCFDVARDIDAHIRSAAATGERIVAGRTSGLLEMGDTITFEARHLGVRQRLTAQVTAFDRPNYFQDQMLRGAFKSLEHDHQFNPLPGGGTRMIDVLRFVAPARRTRPRGGAVGDRAASSPVPDTTRAVLKAHR